MWGEEEVLENFEELDVGDKIFDTLSKFDGKVPVPRTSAVLSELEPLRRQDLTVLYGDYKKFFRRGNLKDFIDR